MEKVLRNRKRKPASKGRVIRVSDDVWKYLQLRRRKDGRESHDCLLRRTFGLDQRNGDPNPLLVGWVEVNTGKFFLDEADARGASIQAAVKRGIRKVDKPIRVREIA